jgi:CubicO group peptidase (beta-lactamase class C family)
MLLRAFCSHALLSSLLGLFSTVQGALECRPEGPVVPRPGKLDESPRFQEATANFTATLERALRGNITAGWPVENVSFSIAVVSVDQEDPAVPIWEYHHLAAKAVNGTKTVDRDSQYLIGSISKVISDILLKKSGLDIDQPVTKWLPGLAANSSHITWNEITLRALASSLSGAPPNCETQSFPPFAKPQH